MSTNQQTRASRLVNLTQGFVHAVKPIEVDGKHPQVLYFDRRSPGFGLRVGAPKKGEREPTRAFFVQAKVGGKTVRVTVGRHPTFNVTQARDAAFEYLRAMKRGENPNVRKREEASKAVTLRDAWVIHHEYLQTRKASPRTFSHYEHVLNCYFKDWLDRALETISRTDVRVRHQRIAANGAANQRKRGKRDGRNAPGTTIANNAMRVLSAVYRRAMREHPSLPACPTVNVNWFRLERRRTAFDAAELRAWYADLMTCDNHIRRDANVFMLFSGMRPAATFEMRWQDVDLDRRVLHVPRPKGGESRAFDLPLSTALVELLRARKAANEVYAPKSEWVFPSPSSKSGHIKEARNQARATRNEIGHQTYDLRRTFITVANSLDVSQYKIKLLVNHVLPQSDVTAGYMSITIDDLRAPMQQIADRLLAIVSTPPARDATVVDLHARRMQVGNEARA
jgi:integrase